MTNDRERERERGIERERKGERRREESGERETMTKGPGYSDTGERNN